MSRVLCRSCRGKRGADDLLSCSHDGLEGLTAASQDTFDGPPVEGDCGWSSSSSRLSEKVEVLVSLFGQ